METQVIIVAYYAMSALTVVGLSVFIVKANRHIVRERHRAKLLADEAAQVKQVVEILDQVHESDKRLISLLKSHDPEESVS